MDAARSKFGVVVGALAVVLLLSVQDRAVLAATIIGTPRNDTLRGTAVGDKLYGKGGDDRLYGAAGDDLLVGGPGNDLLVGGAGADKLQCGPGRDTAKRDVGDKIAGDCEVIRGPGPTPPAPPPPPPPPPLPGQKVDVGGYSLYIECGGSGSPTVVLEQGARTPGASVAGWGTVREGLASETRVCAYDRAGLGASDRRPADSANLATVARELRTLLANAQIPGPYVLVGASFGGLLVLAHTMWYPNDFVGLVFVDGANPGVGLANLPAPEGLTIKEAELAQLVDARLGDRPVVVLTSTESDGPDLARRSSNSMWVSAPGIGHVIAAEAPQLVVEAARVAVASVRTGSPLPPCQQTRLPAVGGRCESVG